MSFINKAKEFATKKHEGQLDDYKLPYINHPKQVADILSVIVNDEEIIAAGWLHDTLEDTDTSLEELVQEFGNRVASLVYEVTHEGKKDNKGYYFPRLESRDAILIKFADRLSNLSRMENWPPDRQKQYLKKSKFWKDSV